VFDGDNYDLWEKALQTTLKSKNKLEFIDGTLKKPKIKEGDFTKYHAWDIVKLMVYSWLLNVIKRKLHPSEAYAKTAKAMWKIYKSDME